MTPGGRSRLEGKLGLALAVWTGRGRCFCDSQEDRPSGQPHTQRMGLAKDRDLGVIRVKVDVQPWTQVSNSDHTGPEEKRAQD